MKFSSLFVILGVLSWQICFAEASILKGTDEEGKPCSLEFVNSAATTNYSGSMMFEFDFAQGTGARLLISASTKSEFFIAYSPAKRLFTYDEFRSNIRTGDIFFERHHECDLQ